MQKNISTQPLARPHIVFLGSVLASFVLLKLLLATFDGLLVSAFIGVACLTLSIGSWKMEMRIPLANQVVLKGICVLFIGYTLFGAWQLPPSASIDSSDELKLLVINVLTLSFLIIGLTRYMFIVPGMSLIIVHKKLLALAWGMQISPTDYMPLVEVAIILGLAPVVYAVFLRFHVFIDKHPVRFDVQNYWLILLAAAVHLSNYFYSAIKKLAISDPPFNWVTDNPTYFLTAAAYENGTLPATLFGYDFSNFLYEQFLNNLTLLNGLTLFAQLLPILLIRNIKWSLYLLIFFDLTHIVIFLTTGIFFYKWIVLNVLFVAAFALMSKFTISFRQYLMLMLVLLAAPSVFFVSFLGWHDTRSYNDEHFIAHSVDGKEYRVPTNYFLATSVTHAQGRNSSYKPGHFPTGALGVLYDASSTSALKENIDRCSVATPERGPIDYSGIEQRIQRHHQFILEKLDSHGRYNYDFYPHHIWSMPWEYSDFKLLDKRKIIGYSYVIQSKCFEAENPKLGKYETHKFTKKYIQVNQL